MQAPLAEAFCTCTRAYRAGSAGSAGSAGWARWPELPWVLLGSLFPFGLVLEMKPRTFGCEADPLPGSTVLPEAECRKALQKHPCRSTATFPVTLVSQPFGEAQPASGCSPTHGARPSRNQTPVVGGQGGGRHQGRPFKGTLEPEWKRIQSTCLRIFPPGL